ncbi:MAG: hypothetical protein ABR591_14460 [Candidatus Velthaea sp.]
MNAVVRVALVLGLLVDLLVAGVSLFAPGWSAPLFDIPVRDSVIAALGGGEYFVVACVYVLLLGASRRLQPLFWIVALDQAVAVVLPAVEVAQGSIPGTFKTLAPLPVSTALAVVFAWAARRST